MKNFLVELFQVVFEVLYIPVEELLLVEKDIADSVDLFY